MPHTMGKCRSTTLINSIAVRGWAYHPGKVLPTVSTLAVKVPVKNYCIQVKTSKVLEKNQRKLKIGLYENAHTFVP